MAKAQRKTEETQPGNLEPTIAQVLEAHQDQSDARIAYQRKELDKARAELTKMKEVNDVCFRGRRDLDKLEQTLRGMEFDDREIDYLLKPKDMDHKFGYGYDAVQNQERTVKRLETRIPKAQTGYVEAEEQRRQANGEHQIG